MKNILYNIFPLILVAALAFGAGVLYAENQQPPVLEKDYWQLGVPTPNVLPIGGPAPIRHDDDPVISANGPDKPPVYDSNLLSANHDADDHDSRSYTHDDVGPDAPPTHYEPGPNEPNKPSDYSTSGQ